MSISYEEYKASEKEKLKALEDAVKAKEITSNSTLVVPHEVEGSTFYFKNYSDIHIPECDMNKLRRSLAQDAKIPGLMIGFGGDQTNMALTNSVSDTYNNVFSPEEELDTMIYTIEDSGIKDKILYYMDGNHGLRLTKETSLRPGKYVTGALKIPQKHVENIALVVVKLDNPIKEGEKVTVTLLVRHGEKSASQVGRKVDITLSKPLIRAVDVVVDGHTHKSFFGSEKFYIEEAGKKTKEKAIYTANFGSWLDGSTYADRAGYAIPSNAMGEVLRMALVPNAEKTDFKLCIDMINERDLINDNADKQMKSVENALRAIEEKEYANVTEVNKAYNKSAKQIKKTSLSKYEKANKADEEFIKKEDYPDKLILFLPGGFVVGDEDVKNDKEIDKFVEQVSKLDDSAKIILNGDMIFADESAFKKTRHPDEYYAYLETLADILEPVKDKIIGYNSGRNEQWILKDYGKELAEKAQVTHQLEDKYAYQKQNKNVLRAKQKTTQQAEVKKHNKSTLKREMSKYYKDYEKFMKKLDGYIADKDKGNMEIIKAATVKMLQDEKRFLTPAKDKDYINHKWPLEEMVDLKPNENLIQNIFFQMLGIEPNPKKLTINPRVNEDKLTSIKIKGRTRKPEYITLVGCHDKSVAGRGAQHGRIGKKETRRPGQYIYYNTSRVGKEYLSSNRSCLINPDGSEDVVGIINNVYISGGRSDNDFSQNRAYKFKFGENRDYSSKKEGRGITQQASDKKELIYASMDYDSMMFDEDIVESVINKQILDSYEYKRDEIEEIQKQERSQKAREAMETALSSKKHRKIVVDAITRSTDLDESRK
jgi:predicted phosphodiesterase